MRHVECPLLTGENGADALAQKKREVRSCAAGVLNDDRISLTWG